MTSNSLQPCFNCEGQMELDIRPKDDAYDCHCEVCGYFVLTEVLLKTGKYHETEDSWVLSAWIRQKNLDKKTPRLEEDYKEKIFDKIKVPRVDEKLNKALETIQKCSEFVGDEPVFDVENSFPLFWAQRTKEMQWMFNELEKVGLIERRLRAMGPNPVCLTALGLAKIEELKKAN